jgi:hypothetical protein
MAVLAAAVRPMKRLPSVNARHVAKDGNTGDGKSGARFRGAELFMRELIIESCLGEELTQNLWGSRTVCTGRARGVNVDSKASLNRSRGKGKGSN